MSFEVNPDSLRMAAGALALLPQDIDKAPHLGAEPVSDVLKASAVGAALKTADPASKNAKDVLKARFNLFSGALSLAAIQYRDTDLEAAQRIAAIADLNNGDAHAGK